MKKRMLEHQQHEEEALFMRIEENKIKLQPRFFLVKKDMPVVAELNWLLTTFL